DRRPPGLRRPYVRLPPTSMEDEFCNSRRLEVNGRLPWNHGFTVCRSVETTSTGFELARVATRRSISSVRACSRADCRIQAAIETTANMSATAATANLGIHDAQIGLVFFWILFSIRKRNSSDGA